MGDPPPPPAHRRVSRTGIRFALTFEQETDVVGPIRLRVQVSAERPDLTLFAGIRKFHNGRKVVFEGSYGFTENIVTRGWLRASHRAIDESGSTVWEAHHPHTSSQSLQTGQMADLDLTLLPSATRFGAGDVLVLELRDRWFFPAPPILGQFPAIYEHSPRQRWSVHTGTSTNASLTVPVWEKETSPSDRITTGL